MQRPTPPPFGVPQALLPFALLYLASAVLYGVLWFMDYGPDGPSPLALWTSSGAKEALTSFTEVVVGVLGITITVVAIIVELAANRYTPRITELFVRDPVNRLVMSAFVVTSVLIIWIDLSLNGPHYPSGMALVANLLMTASLLAILPYFAYVFDFLSPSRVVQRIQNTGIAQLLTAQRTPFAVGPARQGIVQAVEQLGDIALNSVEKNDKPLTLSALHALSTLAMRHVSDKRHLPMEWFDSAPLVQVDQDFIALHPDMVRALSSRRTWLEMKVLRQYQAVFGEAVNEVHDVNHLIGIHTRRLADAALTANDGHTVRLCVRFLNTYLRSGINAGDVRTAYNLLNEYRLLAEALLNAGETDEVLEVAGYITFYGQLAFQRHLPFLLETAAFDLCALLEHAHGTQAEGHDQLLGLFLEVDREPEGGRSQEQSLRGVRKAQIKLATYYLNAHATDAARQIFDDMSTERADRLTSIREELERVERAEYWEVSDRGINFDWLEPARRQYLDTFFGWFDA
ncbi:MAG: DUF2254 domain-containing protein [Myxococcales bacterium]|nr:DUF2254 domain-containing protein [Myxococcales bacterium]